jgi:hypothetical protein
VQALIALQNEQWEIATHSLEEGLALARDMPYPYAEARLLRVDGELHACTGKPEAARERLKKARAIFLTLGAAADAERTGRRLAALI